MVTEHVNYRRTEWNSPTSAPRTFPAGGDVSRLSGAAATSAKALDLACFRRRYIVRTAPHLAHEALLLHLAAELPKGLLELLGVFDDYSHNPTRIPIRRGRCSVNAYSRTSGRTVRPTAMAAKPSAKRPITVRACVPSTGRSGVANAAREWCPGSIRFRTTFKFGPSR